ncbi:MAG: hypothetical protein QXF17_01925 [Ignisphaera sp.]
MSISLPRVSVPGICCGEGGRSLLLRSTSSYLYWAFQSIAASSSPRSAALAIAKATLSFIAE